MSRIRAGSKALATQMLEGKRKLLNYREHTPCGGMRERLKRAVLKISLGRFRNLLNGQAETLQPLFRQSVWPLF
jgi:hypothetical protein